MATIEIGECTFHYRTEGTGKSSLLFVHGAFCDHQDWDHQVEQLRDEFRVVAIDQRCHGASAAPYESCRMEQLAKDVHGIIDALGLGPTIIIGHSLGSRVAIQAAADQPDRLLGVVLLDGSRINGGGETESAGAGATSSSDKLADLLRDSFREMFFDNADPDVRDRILEKASLTPREVVETVINSASSWDGPGVERALAAIPSTLSVLAIQSTYHDATTVRYTLGPDTTHSPWLDFLRSHLPQLEIVITPGVGHFNMLEAPTAVTAAIRAFARRVSGLVAQ